jgi:hypothetical protein
MCHGLTRNPHDVAALVSDADEDQSAVRVGHRCGALSDRSGPCTFFEIDRERLSTGQRRQVRDPVECHISRRAVEQR